MNSDDVINIIQNSRPNDDNLNIFSKDMFIEKINDLSFEDFSSFCSYILKLQEFYDWNCNVWATDKYEHIVGREELFYKPARVDFDSPINFKITDENSNDD